MLHKVNVFKVICNIVSFFLKEKSKSQFVLLFMLRVCSFI